MQFAIQALEQTADWFRRALSVEPVKGNLRLSGYSACGQDGGVQLPRKYVEGTFIMLSVAWLSSSDCDIFICRLVPRSRV